MRPWIALLVLPLAACQTTDAGSPAVTPAAVADLPADYRQQIIVRAKTEFFDPYSIRDASIATAPISGGSIITGSNAIICIKANAKNRMGGYTGMQTTSYIFKGGLITMVDQQYAALTCNPAVYEPFPELEGGYQPPKTQPPAKRKGA